ncbi:helix-turn-helix transcriptional regulator [Herbaspirillum seropedicae]|uniref:helix-turn-helix transcriptional regulator n=1 Tax=Herbaspirillum seropedicae TaxID=964 RepID=UPI001FD175BD|nr:helix-turn-helix transcriptional regulator [Herbaspirillum seropedicae]
MKSPFESDIYAKDRISIVTTQENLAIKKIGFLYDVAMEIHEWVASARKKAKLTQDQMADALGVTRGNVSAWENNRHEPSLSQLMKIGAICHADMSALFAGTSVATPISVKQAAGWPFKIDYQLYATLPADEKERLDDDVTHFIERWHARNPAKSAKTG